MPMPQVLQDWFTMRGYKEVLPGETPPPTPPVTFLQPRDSWLWAGDGDGAVLSVEVKVLESLAQQGTAPTLKIQTAVCSGGPWNTIASYTSADSETLVLKREPGGTDRGIKLCHEGWFFLRSTPKCQGCITRVFSLNRTMQFRRVSTGNETSNETEPQDTPFRLDRVQGGRSPAS
jgi:hypothetical protein